MWRDEFPDRITAALMETYYGGRTESRIRKVAVPGTYLDFLSQYPTTFVLMGMWSYLVADRISWESADQKAIQRFVDRITLNDLFDRRVWKQLHVIVLVDPDGDLLPTRARYGAAPVFNVGVNYRSGEPQYWTLADVIASKIALGKSPRILAAYRFEASGRQASLAPMTIGGTVIDPASEDLIKRLVEVRGRLKEQATAGTGDPAPLLAQAQGIKIAANSIAYGSAIEMNVVEQLKPPLVDVYLADGTTYDARPQRTERMGRWFNPVVATCVSAGGRLLLAMAMECLSGLGGEYAMCDTDSLFVVSKSEGGDVTLVEKAEGSSEQVIHACSWDEVDGLVERFTSLNPYKGGLKGQSILQIESVNFGPDGGRRTLECMTIASKRYVLFVRETQGLSIVARKEHGLGHLMDPTNGDCAPASWIDQWWEYALRVLLGESAAPPEWFSLPAVGRLSITAPREEEAFTSFNDGLAYARRIRPSNFLIVARPHRLQRGPTLLVAPYEPDPLQWINLAWSDRSVPDDRTYRIRAANPEIQLEGEICVQTYGGYFKEFLLHPEVKSTDFDGSRCHPWTQGLLGRRRVVARALMRIGKESNRLSGRPEVDHSRLISYGVVRGCPSCGERVRGTRAKYCSDACKQKAYRRRKPGGKS